MTVVGTPLGGSRKPKPCPTDFRLCFHDVKIAAQPGPAEGPLTYDVSGILGTQQTPAGPVDPVWFVFVYLVDLAFPETDWTTSTAKPWGTSSRR
jgi:hypothetical protein